jgi:gamma-glutamyltranspeptidase/glutathione hydrolase
MNVSGLRLDRCKVIALACLLGLIITVASAPVAPAALPAGPTVTANGMVASPEPFATDVGVAILEAGGNAFDATAAVHFALAVTYPTAGNIGGGGFLVGLPAEAEPFALDFREAAPAAAARDMYLDADGNMIDGLSTRTHKGVGVPGSVDGMLELVERYGNLSRQQVLAAAIRLARDGFPISYRLSRGLRRSDKLRQFPATVAAFGLHGDGPQMGAVLVQSDLANTLETVSREGRSGFYTGRVADLIVADMQAHDGLITLEDLEGYSVKWPDPLVFTHGDYEWITHPLPSSGGMTIAQMLGLLHVPTMQAAGYHSSEAISMVTEAQRLAFADRNYWLGDPAFFDVPVARLTSPRYIERRRRLLPADGLAGDSDDVVHGQAESEETTHYTVVDRWGNVAAVTTTLNSSYGMGAVANGAGFLWNNQMDNFSAKPGVPNQYGMLGAEANAVEPGKRPLSSMTPSIIRRDGQFFMTMGSPGGPTIINTVLQIYLNVTVWGMDIQRAIDAARVHSQWLPDLIYHERFAISAETQSELWRMGYELRERGAIGMAAGIMRTPEGYLAGHADRRGAGTAKGY